MNNQISPKPLTPPKNTLPSTAPKNSTKVGNDSDSTCGFNKLPDNAREKGVKAGIETGIRAGIETGIRAGIETGIKNESSRGQQKTNQPLKDSQSSIADMPLQTLNRGSNTKQLGDLSALICSCTDNNANSSNIKNYDHSTNLTIGVIKELINYNSLNKWYIYNKESKIK